MRAQILVVGLLCACTSASAAPEACPAPELSLGCTSCHGAKAPMLPTLPSDAAELFDRLRHLREAPQTGTVMPRMLGGLDDATLRSIAESVVCEQRQQAP